MVRVYRGTFSDAHVSHSDGHLRIQKRYPCPTYPTGRHNGFIYGIYFRHFAGVGTLSDWARYVGHPYFPKFFDPKGPSKAEGACYIMAHDWKLIEFSQAGFDQANMHYRAVARMAQDDLDMDYREELTEFISCNLSRGEFRQMVTGNISRPSLRSTPTDSSPVIEGLSMYLFLRSETFSSETILEPVEMRLLWTYCHHVARLFIMSIDLESNS